MNRSKRIADLINLIMYAFCISVAQLFLFDAITGLDEGILPLFSGSFILLLYVYFLRVKIRRMPVFVALHLPPFAVLAALWILLSESVLLMIVLMFCLTLADVVFWMGAVQEEKSMPVSENGEAIKGFRPIFKEGFGYIPLPFVAVFVLALAFGVYGNRPYYGKIAYTLGVLYIGLYFLRQYVLQVSNLVRQMHRETQLHQKRIITANAKLALPFIGAAFVLMFLLQSDFLIRLAEKAVMFAIKWIGWFVFTAWFFILSLFSGSDEGGSLPRGTLTMPQVEEPGWASVFEKLVEHFLIALFYGLLLFLIVRAVIFFIRKFSKRSVNAVRKEDFPDMTEVRERIGKGERHRREKEERISGTNTEKIRKLYRRFIRKQIRNGLTVEKYNTPLELVKPLTSVTSIEEAALVDITNLYDRARYGGSDLPKADVVRMEKLL
ncbi:MAG: DUF4129 domain-containing protein [Lachnospiraceae bacterium]|nr:DUF4129 domain-containing protein [Lachnospiraceae bacterium]